MEVNENFATAFIFKNLSCLLEYPEMVIRRLYDTVPTHFSGSRGAYFIEIGEVMRPLEQK